MRLATLYTYFTIVISSFLLSCGGGPITIDVDVPINQDSPFDELLNVTGAVVFFEFDRLVANPTSVNDLAGDAPIRFPTTAPFLPPSSERFDLSEVNLDKNAAYRVTMFGSVDPNLTTTKYRGVSDCPLIQANGEDNIIHICFGLLGQTPLCIDTVSFANCPGL